MAIMLHSKMLEIKKRKHAMLRGGRSAKHSLMNKNDGPHNEPRKKTRARVLKKVAFIKRIQ